MKHGSHSPAKPNLALKVAILESGLTQRRVAQRLGISDSRMSNIVLGVHEPSDAMRRAMAKLLRRDESALFPQTATIGG